MGCFSGHLMSSASDQKLFCEVCSALNCSFNEFVGEKVVSPSYSSTILAPPPNRSYFKLEWCYHEMTNPWFSSVQSLIHVQLFAAPWTATCQASLSITNSQNLLKLMSIKSVTPSNHLILCRSLLLLPSIFASLRVFSSEWGILSIRWPMYWHFSFNISSSNEYTGLIYFRIDWLDPLAVQGTLKSLSNTTVQKHQFFSTQLSL